jgi:hypothetical protein
VVAVLVVVVVVAVVLVVVVVVVVVGKVLAAPPHDVYPVAHVPSELNALHRPLELLLHGPALPNWQSGQSIDADVPRIVVLGIGVLAVVAAVVAVVVVVVAVLHPFPHRVNAFGH